MVWKRSEVGPTLGELFDSGVPLVPRVERAKAICSCGVWYTAGDRPGVDVAVERHLQRCDGDVETTVL